MGGLSACSRWLSEGAPQQTRFECGSWGSVSHQVPNCRAKCLLVSPHPPHGHVAVIGFLVTHDCQANGRFPGTSLPTQLSDGGGMFGKNSLFPVLVTLCLLPESSVQLYFVCANTFIVIHSFVPWIGCSSPAGFCAGHEVMNSTWPLCTPWGAGS